MLESRYLDNNSFHYLSLKKLTPKQWLNIKELIINANNRLNKVFPLFISFSSEFSSEDRLIDIFPSCFSFHSSNRKSKESRKVYIHKLNKLTL